MRGIRIWHLAALGLCLPLLTAALPPGCYGGLNPNFWSGALNQDAAVGITPPRGYHVVGIFDETGWPGTLDLTVQGQAATTAWSLPFGALTPEAYVWACDLQQIAIGGGTLFVPDATGQVQQVGITYSGPTLDLGNQLVCGSLVKLRVVPITIQGQFFTIWPPGSTPQTVNGLEYHVFVDIINK